MGHAIESLQFSWRTLTDHPMLLLGIGGVGVAGTLVSSVVGMIPVVGALISWIVVTPVMLAAVLTMAEGALEGAPSYGDLREGVADHWKPLVAAYAALVGVVVGLGAVAGAVIAVALYASGISLETVEPGSTPPVGPELAAAFAVVALLSAGVLVVVQFVDVSVVVGDAGPLEAFGVAWRLVRAAPASAVGYSLLRVLVTVVPFAAVWAGSFVLVEAAVGQVLWLAMGLAILGSLIVGPVVATLGLVYHVAFFDRLDAEHRLGASGADVDAFDEGSNWGSDAESSA